MKSPWALQVQPDPLWPESCPGGQVSPPSQGPLNVSVLECWRLELSRCMLCGVVMLFQCHFLLIFLFETSEVCGDGREREVFD